MSLYAPLKGRSILLASGPDAKDFLQGLLCNDMQLLEDQPAIYAALLSPQGKVISTMFVINNPGGGYFLDCPQGVVEALQKRLNLFRLRADVEIKNVSASWQVFVSDTQVVGICFADPRHTDAGFRILCPKVEVAQVTDNAAKQRNSMRILNILPEQDVDFQSVQVFPTDINMDLHAGIAWRKGCYVGQEVVSRMKRRGSIRKRTALLHFTGQALPVGAPVMAGKSRLGMVTSCNDAHALAMVRTDRTIAALEAGDELICDGRSISVTLPTEQN